MKKKLRKSFCIKLKATNLKIMITYNVIVNCDKIIIIQ